MAAIDQRRWQGAARRALGAALKLLGLAMLAPQARAVDLPEDRAEAMVHLYDGGGVRASGPALLVRKRVADQFSLSGNVYVDMVSNASIDVVTTASPFRETRKEWGLALDHVVKDTLMHLGLTRSSEPDYDAQSLNADVSQEVFGGMTTVALGFTRGQDDVGRHGEQAWVGQARHWQYRLGVTQVLSPRWLLSANGEVLADDGYLGNPYRVARVFGSAVAERVPHTRHAQALKLRLLGDVGHDGVQQAIYGEYRYYHDTWAIQAHTLEAGWRRQVDDRLRVDAFARLNRQGDAVFYSDNASTETLYISRNRQLSAFTSRSLGGKLAWHLDGKTAAAYQITANASLEWVHFSYSHFTDLRTGKPYAFNGALVQLYATGKF